MRPYSMKWRVAHTKRKIETLPLQYIAGSYLLPHTSGHMLIWYPIGRIFHTDTAFCSEHLQMNLRKLKAYEKLFQYVCEVTDTVLFCIVDTEEIHR